MFNNSTTIILLLAILAIGLVILAIIFMTRRGGKVLDAAKYQQRWLRIETSLRKENPDSYQMSILQADKLLDMALKERGFKGQTMGERMKMAQDTWKNPNHIWGAHKIRNRIAHEPDVKVTYEIAARSLAAFKQGLHDLGAF